MERLSTPELIREDSPKPSTPESIGSGSGYSNEDVVEIKPNAQTSLQIKTTSLEKYLKPQQEQLTKLQWHELFKKIALNKEITRIKTAHDQASHAIHQVERALGGTYLDQKTQENFYNTATENPEQLSALILQTRRFNKAATGIQRWQRRPNKLGAENLSKARQLGKRVRSQTVFPSEIKKFLDTNLNGLKTAAIEDKDEKILIPSKDIDNNALSKAIAREILELSTSGALGEHGVLLDIGKSYAFASEVNLNIVTQKKYRATTSELANRKKKATQVKLPIELWVKKTPEGVEIEMVGQKLGSGTYKKVFASRTFDMDLSTEAHGKSPIKKTAAVQANNARANTDLLTGNQLVQEEFADELDQGTLRVASLVTHTGRQRKLSNESVIVARDIQYDGDLDNITDPNTLLQAFSDIAETLLKFHSKGIVHRDPKPPNMLTKEGRGFLGDLGLTERQGYNERISPTQYEYWDPLSQNCYVTPFSDAHGLARSMCEKLFGAAYENSEDEIRNLRLFRNPPPQLKAIRDGIAAIFDANKLTLKFLNQNPEIEAQLTHKDPKEIQKAVDALQNKFPAYNNFIKLVSETRPQ
ncbi:MAG: hypothetical protein WCK42_07080 [Myxococcaceae bacterium]